MQVSFSPTLIASLDKVSRPENVMAVLKITGRPDKCLVSHARMQEFVANMQEIVAARERGRRSMSSKWSRSPAS